MGYFIDDAEKRRKIISDEETFIQKPMSKNEISGMMKKMFEPKSWRDEYELKPTVKEQPQPPRHPKKYFSKRKAIIRLREIGGDEIIQHEGLIYRLDKNDPNALALYGGHQVIVLNQELVDFEKWMIVSVTELW